MYQTPNCFNYAVEPVSDIKQNFASHGEISTVFLALGSVTHAFTGCSTKTELHQMHHP